MNQITVINEYTFIKDESDTSNISQQQPKFLEDGRSMDIESS